MYSILLNSHSALDSRPVIAKLLKKYHKEKWLLSPAEVMCLYERMGIQYKKFHTPGFESKLSDSINTIWFGLKSGVFFYYDEFLMIGDSMDELHTPYQLKTSLRKRFLKVEGYTLYYQNGDSIKKMTMSGPEMKFLIQYVRICDKWLIQKSRKKREKATVMDL